MTGGNPSEIAHGGVEPALEIAHVLFMDIVGYSLLAMAEQSGAVGELQRIVSAIPAWQRAISNDSVITLPSGDGMALVFFGDPLGPVDCAKQISIGLRKSQIALRMGIHSGPVYRIADMNANANVAGGGINFAQRVMDIGDAGHILISRSCADMLFQIDPTWRSAMEDLGEVTVKHGVAIHILNFCGDTFGNRARPARAPPPGSGTANPPKRITGRYWLAAAFATLILLVSTLLFLRRSSTAEDSFRPDRVSKLTTSGKAVDAAVSNDGRYVLYVQKNGDHYTIRLREVSTGADRERIGETGAIYSGLTFAPGNSAFYYLVDERKERRTLYVAPLIEGAARKTIEDVDSPVAISPDGRLLEFVRGEPSQGKTSLLIANADGSNIRPVAARSFAESFLYGGSAWTSDGRHVILPAFSAPGKALLYQVNVDTGRQEAIAPLSWEWIGRVSLGADAHHLVFTAEDPSSNALQIYDLSLDTRKLKPITNDLSSYAAASLGGKTLVAIEQNRLTAIWTTSLKDLSSHAITPPAGRYFELAPSPGNSWFTLAGTGPELNIWRVFSDGTSRQVTSGPHVDANPAVSTDGKTLVFVSNRSGGWQLWTSDIDGRFLRQLTHGSASISEPTIEPSGDIIYSEQSGGSVHLMRMHADGGNPAEVLPTPAKNAVISGDGGRLACELEDGETWKTAVLSLPDGKVIRVFDDIPLGSWMQWMPDRETLAYIKTANGISNLALRPIAGGEDRMLTHFSEDEMFAFAISPNAQSIASIRGIAMSDVVLFEQLH